MRRFRLAYAVLVVLAMMAPPAVARIKLITLPKRERVEIQLDQPNVTLVEEERIVPLPKGVNQVDFSWANTAIDKDSIQFRALADPEGIKVLSVSYPPNENALVWQVSAGQSGPARVRTVYGERGRLAGLPSTLQWEIVEYRRQTLQVHAARSRGLEIRLVLRFEGRGTGTMVRQAAELRSGLWGPLGWLHEALVAVPVAWSVRAAAAGAKRAFEGDPPG